MKDKIGETLPDNTEENSGGKSEGKDMKVTGWLSEKQVFRKKEKEHPKTIFGAEEITKTEEHS